MWSDHIPQSVRTDAARRNARPRQNRMSMNALLMCEPKRTRAVRREWGISRGGLAARARDGSAASLIYATRASEAGRVGGPIGSLASPCDTLARPSRPGFFVPAAEAMLLVPAAAWKDTRGYRMPD
jgi:hypothetical protein